MDLTAGDKRVDSMLIDGSVVVDFELGKCKAGVDVADPSVEFFR